MKGNNVKTYGAYCKDVKLRKESSSGAVFSVLAGYVLNNSGVIYGVAMSEDCREAVFCRVFDIEALDKLRCSKYLQARVGDTYKNVKKDLEAGLTVLFTGVSCQINALKIFLKRDYDNLYCVDVMCHGVPSPALWKKYVDFLEKKTSMKISSVNFRSKKENWLDFGFMAGGRKKIYVPKECSAYMQMFLKDYCLRPSCYNCAAKKNKLSDITIADFWGVKDVCPQIYNKYGVSLVVIRSEKGNYLFENIKDKMIYCTAEYEKAVQYNPADYSSVSRPPQRNDFFENMKKMDFEELETYYLKTGTMGKIKRMLLKTPFRRIIRFWNEKKSNLKRLVK